jgi:hypothetical protein
VDRRDGVGDAVGLSRGPGLDRVGDGDAGNVHTVGLQFFV